MPRGIVHGSEPPDAHAASTTAASPPCAPQLRQCWRPRRRPATSTTAAAPQACIVVHGSGATSSPRRRKRPRSRKRPSASSATAGPTQASGVEPPRRRPWHRSRLCLVASTTASAPTDALEVRRLATSSTAATRRLPRGVDHGGIVHDSSRAGALRPQLRLRPRRRPRSVIQGSVLRQRHAALTTMAALQAALSAVYVSAPPTRGVDHSGGPAGARRPRP